MHRTLHLNSPLLHGDDVLYAQKLLTHNVHFGDFMHGAPVNGKFDHMTADAVLRAKRALGYPKSKITTAFGSNLERYLKTGKLPKAYAIRRKLRLRHKHKPADIRSKIVQEFKWGIARSSQIHYRQSRPMPLGAWQKHALPLSTDCSGSITCCFKRAGAPDPNGQKYSGQGFTGSMLQHLHRIERNMLKPGDLIVFGEYPGVHVCGVIDPAGDPLLFSHGQEDGPLLIHLSLEAAAHAGHHPVFLSAGV